MLVVVCAVRADEAAMASFDSVAEFAAALAECGMESHVAGFAAKGVRTYSDLAYMSSYRPGGDEAVFDAKVLEKLLGDADHQDAPRLRRLHSDAWAMAVHRVERRLSSTGDEAPQRLPLVEREERLASFKRAHTGIPRKAWETWANPSFRAMDLAHALHETNTVSYVDPADCTSRSAELDGTKVDRFLQRDSKGYIREHEKVEHGKASTADVTLFRQALHRRAVALHIGRVCSFAAIEEWHEDLATQMQEDAPVGFVPVSIQQALDADRRMWKHIAMEVSGKVRAPSNVSLDDVPFAKALERLQYRPDLRIHLAHRQGRGSAQGGGTELQGRRGQGGVPRPEAGQPARERGGPAEEEAQGAQRPRRPRRPGWPR